MSSITLLPSLPLPASPITYPRDPAPPSEVPPTLCTELKPFLSSQATHKPPSLLKTLLTPLGENSGHTTSYFSHALHLEAKIKIIEKDNIQEAIPSPGGSPWEEAAGSLDQGILAPAVFAHKMVSHLETHIKRRVNHQSSELGADVAGKQDFSADFNLGKHLFQLSDRQQALGQGTHALHLLICMWKTAALQRGSSAPTEDHRVGSL